MKYRQIPLYAALTMGLGSVVFAAGPGVVTSNAGGYRAMLANAYANVSHLENNDRTDQIDAYVLKNRALAAYRGNVVTPLHPDEVRSVQATPAQLAADYAAINRVIGNAETVQQHPREVALAQASYDCYALQQQSEPYASHNLRRCEPTFRYLMARLDKPQEPAPVAAQPAPTLVRYDVVETQTVYFDWDKATLNQEARGTLDTLKASMQGEENAWKRLALEGHADRSGPATYNVGLSQRRVDAVSRYLNIVPVDNAEVDFKAMGEANPPVATADGVREERNRVVKVSVVKEKTKVETPRDN